MTPSIVAAAECVAVCQDAQGMSRCRYTSMVAVCQGVDGGERNLSRGCDGGDEGGHEVFQEISRGKTDQFYKYPLFSFQRIPKRLVKSLVFSFWNDME